MERQKFIAMKTVMHMSVQCRCMCACVNNLPNTWVTKQVRRNQHLRLEKLHSVCVLMLAFVAIFAQGVSVYSRWHKSELQCVSWASGWHVVSSLCPCGSKREQQCRGQLLTGCNDSCHNVSTWTHLHTAVHNVCMCEQIWTAVCVVGKLLTRCWHVVTWVVATCQQRTAVVDRL